MCDRIMCATNNAPGTGRGRGAGRTSDEGRTPRTAYVWGLAPKSDNEVMCWLEIKQNPGRAGLEAQGRAGLRRRPCEARKFRVFETQITQICLPSEGTHVDPRHVQTHRKRVLNKGIMKTPAK